MASCIGNHNNNAVDETKCTPIVGQIAQKPQPEKQTNPKHQVKTEQAGQETLPVSELGHSMQPSLTTKEQPKPTQSSQLATVLPKASKVSLEVKIGQMLIVGFRGLSVNNQSPIIRDIKQLHLGGVILFDYDLTLKSSRRNIKSPEQVKKLVEQLQAAATQKPFFIAIDQEGGQIRRLKEKFGFPHTVSAQYFGKKNDLALTYKHATSIAQTLANLGINFNLAPVVDLNINPNNPVIGKLERSFSADPNIVTNHALEFIRAHNEHNIVCAIKHFPGHGSSTNDSHLGLVDVTNTWVEKELEPYRTLIQLDQANAIMTAHVFNRHYDPNYPATLSKRIITELLRTELQYNGVIVSDDMQMKAISNHYSFEYAIQVALEAGIDIIVIGNNLKYEEDIAARTIAVIKQLIQEGKLSEERIDESYKRIQKLKRGVIRISEMGEMGSQ